MNQAEATNPMDILKVPTERKMSKMLDFIKALHIVFFFFN